MLTENDFIVEKKDGAYFILYKKTLVYKKLNENNFKIFKENLDKQGRISLHGNIEFENYVDNIFARDIDDKLKEKYDEKKLSKLELILNNSCNLDCKYCYASGGNYGIENNFMKPQEAINYIDDLLASGIDEINVVMFFGGEPLLSFNTIVAVVKKFSELFKNGKIGKIPKYTIVTNGTLINEKIAIFFYEEDFQVTVSIDGNPYLHNYLRPYKNGNPSFDDVDKAINLLQKYNVNIGILEITYTKFHENNNISKKDLEDYFKNRYGDISLYITNCSGDNIYAIDVNKFVENDIIYEKNVKLSVLRKLLGKGNYKICCDAGSGSFAISPTGTIIPCHFFMGHNEYLMGQLPKTNLANKETLDINYIFRNTDKRISDDCSDCWIRDLCAECPASILIQNKEKINESCSIKRIKREKIIRDFIRNGDIY